MPTFTVTLNGTHHNPYETLGFTQNPFPAIPDASLHPSVNGCLADLASRPIVGHADIRERLSEVGASAEFIALCIAQYRPGRVVRFAVSFPDEEE